MSSIPANLARVPNLLTSRLATSNLARSNLDMFRLQTAIATGRRVLAPSDDPVATAAISVLDDRLERADQRLRNFALATSHLNVLDQALGEASETALEAKAIASTQVSFGHTTEERASNAVVLQSMINGALGLANRDSSLGHLFGASGPGQAPFAQFYGGIRYTGRGDGLTTDLGEGVDVPVTLGPSNPIGAVSARIRGAVDLDPVLTGATRLVDIRGGRGVGVSLGAIVLAFGSGPNAPLDLAGADTLSDVLDTLTASIRQYEADNGVTILGAGGVSTSAGSISIDVVPGPDALRFEEIGDGVTARDLGLAGDTPFTFSATSPTGADLDPMLTWTTPITALAGLAAPLGTIRVNNVGRSRILDLSGAQSLQDVRNILESADMGIRVQINADATGIDVLNEVAAGAAGAMSISEVTGGGGTATLLGIRTYSGETRISDFNNGRGIEIVDGSVDPVTGLPDPIRDIDFAITLGDGTIVTVDLRPQDIATVQTVIDRINAEATAQGVPVPGDFQATLSDGVSGLVLAQNPSFPAPLTVERRNNSPAFEQLGLADGAWDATSASLAAQDRAKVRVDNIFSQLIDLRDSLNSDDTDGITLAGERIEGALAAIAQTRALVGGYAQRVEGAMRRQEEQMLLDEKTRSDLRDLDYTEAAVRLGMLQTQLEAGLRSVAQAQSLSLLDFLV